MHVANLQPALQVPSFLAALGDAGADVVRVDAYETALGHAEAGAALLEELRRIPPRDLAIAFSSIAEVCLPQRYRRADHT